MKKYKALLIKDFQINKKTLMTPIWITAGFYLLIILSVAIAFFKGDLNLIDLRFDDIDIRIPSLIFMINMGILSLPGLIALLFTITITQSSLNEDLRRNCELFHRSQPVSFWLRALSKYTVGIGGNWAVLFILAVFNYLVVNIILAFLGQFNLSASVTGLLLAFLVFAKISLLIGSITFFLSAVFKDKAFFTGAGILLGVQFLFLILNALLGWKLPLPIDYLLGLIKFNSGLNYENNLNILEYREVVADFWKVGVWNLKSLLQILVSGMFFAAAALIYNNREVK